jgi:hypothetical protein
MIKQTFANVFKIAALVLTVSFLHACKKTKIDQPVVPVITNTIAYIYKTDNTNALAYKTLMEANNCAVTLIEKATAITTDYSKYKLIVIDNNTDIAGVGGEWTTTDAATIKAAGKPLLLMGAGGLYFAAKNGNIINWEQSEQYNETSIVVTDPASTVFSRPKTIVVDVNTKRVALFNAAGLMAAQYVPTITLANVSIIGRNALNFNYVPVALESNRYGFFAFYNGVNNMTQAGKDFMVNYTYYVGGLTL